MRELSGTIKNPQRHYLLLTFFISLGTAALLFIPFMIYHGGIFYYYGDFNVQEIPFYQLIHGEIQNGSLGWNHLTDLGTDTIASYSFYLLGSPFFWMTLPFPNEFVPYLIGPLLILKFACAATAAYIYVQRYVSHVGSTGYIKHRLLRIISTAQKGGAYYAKSDTVCAADFLYQALFLSREHRAALVPAHRRDREHDLHGPVVGKQLQNLAVTLFLQEMTSSDLFSLQHHRLNPARFEHNQAAVRSLHRKSRYY